MLRVLTISIFLSSTSLAQVLNDSVIFYRIESIYQAKKEIMDKVWPLVNDTAFNIPFIYYTDTTSFVVNPRRNFIRQFEPKLRFQKENLAIFQTKERMDDAQFHMEVRISDVPTDYNYDLPYGKTSGLDEVQKYAPDLPIENWTGMILHELFHGYQFRHKEFRQHAVNTKLIYSVINDSLQRYYKEQPWFKTSIDEENNLILKATTEKDKRLRKSMIAKMLSLRDERRVRVMKDFNRDIAFYERSFETFEGTARYIEEMTNANFHKVKLSPRLRKIDPDYSVSRTSTPKPQSEMAFKTELSQLYTYATGYNMTKLLDALGVDYKTKLFNKAELTLEDFLRAWLK